jgi:hypothetical protein
VTDLLEEVDGDDEHGFLQDGAGVTTVTPDEADWTADEQ